MLMFLLGAYCMSMYAVGWWFWKPLSAPLLMKLAFLFAPITVLVTLVLMWVIG